ncbi:MAG: bifunctional phosphoglucose/phosphomannose isomerase [Candidatus Colwellbacteria bacterium CG10_big_fil_rev_8_21_14_0_10_42_22]|uniref:Bifunctional phosphoglucose/phosphomannose isomerase n=1 Tax=Candidatus Colwellbacteria bacterium CG10_big_fil_rev_8_21_14_0_10_42_22 TaxID=1974540 RepID=A0A2H0VF69_9BACT|nr:MAG: bifunctional phosphoglucose/phosphomannose isomerase [Candidatus Colwellbacteria bacterium CG10_big_fil_rev_8_21_14_0_10_42_22]
MIEKDIREFSKQFAYKPEIGNANKLGDFETIVIGGMGGSGLVAGILRALKPGLDIVAHHEYGLPTFVKKDASKRLFIAISHSGNTEETLDFCRSAIDNNFSTAIIASGGKLLELAKKKGLPYIDLPGDDIQPRMALGYMLRAMLKLLGEDELFEEVGSLVKILDAGQREEDGRELADKLFKKIPVIYASRANQILAYNWKIKLNETGKIPAFYNTFPELNHNEMNGFDIQNSNKELSSQIHFIFLRDKDDYSRTKKRMDVLEKMYGERRLDVENVVVKGDTKLERIFNTLILGDWFSFYTAKKYGTEPEQVPMVEEFKKFIQ